VGDLCPSEFARRGVGPRVRGSQPFGLVPVGAGVYGTTGRLEKGYRLMGAELDGEYNVVEAGLQRAKVKSADFVGKDAYLKAREEGAGRDPLHADGRRSHVATRRHQALHVRANGRSTTLDGSAHRRLEG